MLIRQDDYPIHQTPEPLAHTATSDKNFYDRFFFNGYSADGALFFAAAFGVYPNRRLMDAAFDVMLDGRQYVLHASRHAHGERGPIEAGPISITIDEPMRRLSLRVAPNEYELEAELVFEARTAPIEEPRFVHRVDHQVLMDCTRITQFGQWRGWLRVRGQRFELTPDRFRGCRDRSWGVRALGQREEMAPAGEPQFFWLWAPVNFDDVCTHFDVNEDADGHAWHRNGVMARVIGTDAVEPTDTSSIEPMRSVRHDIRWQPGTRRSIGADLVLTPWRGDEIRLALEPIATFQMLGLGYLDPEWGHGLWKGPLAVGGNVIDLEQVEPLDPRFIHVQQLCHVRMGERQGMGVFEQLAIGRHAPSGFESLFDGAPGPSSSR